MSVANVYLSDGMVCSLVGAGDWMAGGEAVVRFLVVTGRGRYGKRLGGSQRK